MGLFGLVVSKEQKGESVISFQEKVVFEPPTKMLEQQLILTQISEKDLHVLKSIKPLIEKDMDEMMDLFYEQLLKVPELDDIIRENSTTERLKKHCEVIFWNCLMVS